MSQYDKRRVQCPVCRSNKTVKDGFYGKSKKTQRYICRGCGLRFPGQLRTRTHSLLTNKLLNHIWNEDFNDVESIAKKLKTTRQTIDSKILSLADHQVKQFDSRIEGVEINMSFYVAPLKKPLSVSLTIDKYDWIVNLDIDPKVSEKKSVRAFKLENRITSFFKERGLANKIELSRSMNTAIRRLVAFIFIWNFIRGSSTNSWPWNRPDTVLSKP